MKKVLIRKTFFLGEINMKPEFRNILLKTLYQSQLYTTRYRFSHSRSTFSQFSTGILPLRIETETQKLGTSGTNMFVL